jgi:hypothetical protein
MVVARSLAHLRRRCPATKHDFCWVMNGPKEAVNGNIKALLRPGRGYHNLNYLLLKAQRLAATSTEVVAFQKAA